MTTDDPQRHHEHLVRIMLSLMGENPDRDGLKDTPKRVVAAWSEWFGGYKKDPASLFKTFAIDPEESDTMVLVSEIPVESHCEHHLAPFVGKASVAYIPSEGRVVGLSKIPRLVNIFAKRLQVQERLTTQIADTLHHHLKPKGVGVIIRAEHFCMATRGVHVPGAMTTTSALRGIFKNPEVRAEFLTLAGVKR